MEATQVCINRWMDKEGGVVQSLSPAQLFATPWTVAHQASLSFTVSQSLLKLMSIESVMPSNHLILCHPLLLLPSIFPIIRVFSSESVLCIRWPKYWWFSISPSNEYSGLISFRIDWAGTFYEIVNLPWLAWTLQFFLALCCWSLVSQNLLKFVSIELVMPSNHLILCRPLLLPPSIFPSIRVFSSESASHQVAKLLEFQLQHQSKKLGMQ